MSLEPLASSIKRLQPKDYLGYLRQLVNYASGERLSFCVDEADLLELIGERTLDDLVDLAHQSYPIADHPHLVGLFEQIADMVRSLMGMQRFASSSTTPDVSEASIFVLIARAQIAAGIRKAF